MSGSLPFNRPDRDDRVPRGISARGAVTRASDGGDTVRLTDGGDAALTRRRGVRRSQSGRRRGFQSAVRSGATL